MNRRDFIGHGARLTAGALFPALAPAAQGPSDKVYLNYSQQELDAAYDDAAWAPNMRQLLARQAATGVKVRARFAPQTLSYGDKPSEKLDVFSPARTGTRRPVMVFVHGGNWRFGSKESISYIAPTFLKHNAIFVAPEYDPLPNHTMAGMVDQCRRALLWVWRHAEQLGADPERIYVGGHSAGGHLASMLLTTDWTQLGAPAKLLKGGLVLSGLCDLEPVVMAAGNRHVRLTPNELIQYSPVHTLHKVDCPVLVAWGSRDSPEFRRQSMVMAQGLRATGRLAGSFELAGVNHFEILDAMQSDESILAQATLALVR